jgi:hypothetical protein
MSDSKFLVGDTVEFIKEVPSSSGYYTRIGSRGKVTAIRGKTLDISYDYVWSAYNVPESAVRRVQGTDIVTPMLGVLGAVLVIDVARDWLNR